MAYASCKPAVDSILSRVGAMKCKTVKWAVQSAIVASALALWSRGTPGLAACPSCSTMCAPVDVVDAHRRVSCTVQRKQEAQAISHGDVKLDRNHDSGNISCTI